MEPQPHPQLLMLFIPYVSKRLSDPYHLDESTFIYESIEIVFSFWMIFFCVCVSKQKSPSLDATFADSLFWLFCLTMPHKKESRPFLSNAKLCPK